MMLLDYIFPLFYFSRIILDKKKKECRRYWFQIMGKVIWAFFLLEFFGAFIQNTDL